MRVINLRVITDCGRPFQVEEEVIIPGVEARYRIRNVDPETFEPVEPWREWRTVRMSEP